MIDEETGESVACPICEETDVCDHWVGTIDGSFGEVFGPLDRAYQKTLKEKYADGSDWDEDFDVLLRSISDFIEDELYVEREHGIDPGGPGMTSALRAYYAENVGNVVEQVTKKFVPKTLVFNLHRLRLFKWIRSLTFLGRAK